jgi:hypothetical protein
LTTLAVAQPVLDSFGQSPETFVFLGQSQPVEIIRFALIVLIVPAVALWAAGVAVGLFGRPARLVAHQVTLGVLAGLLAVVVTKRATDLEGLPLAVVGLAVGVAFAVVHRRYAAARSWTFAAGLALPVVGLAFVLTSPTADLLEEADALPLPVAATEVASDTPIVMLVLDGFPTVTRVNGRAGIDAARYPNFARLAADSLWLRNATTNGGFTQLAVPAMLTGQLPTNDRDAIWTDHPDNLFNLLGGSYELHVSESLTQLCAPSVCDGDPPPGRNEKATETPDEDAPEPADDSDEGTLGPLLDEAVDVYRSQISLGGDSYDPGVAFEEETSTTPTTVPTTTLPPPESPGEGRAEGRSLDRVQDRLSLLSQPNRYREFLAQMGRYGDRTLHFLHLVLPHRPWRLFPDGTAYGAPDLLDVGVVDGETQYLDTLLGRFLDRLEALDLYDDALLIVAADHGASFADGEPLRLLTLANAAEIAWTPMFVKEPGRTDGEVSDVNAESIDVLPTVTDVLGVDPPWEIDGRSVLAPPAGARANKRFVQRASPITPDPGVLVAPDGFSSSLLSDRAMPRLSRRDLSTAGLYAGRQFAGTLGRPTDQLAAAPSTGVVARVDGVDDFARVDTAGAVPAFVTGSVEGSTPGDVFAFSLNGRVAGLSPVVSWGSRPAMVATLLPHDLFVDGANDLEVVRLARAGDGSISAEPAVLVSG